VDPFARDHKTSLRVVVERGMMPQRYNRSVRL
jgi:hypothetical protein